FGSAPSTVSASAYWPGWDIARAGAGAGTSGGSRQGGPPPSTRKIVVNLGQQHLYAYENGKLLMDTDVTTGRPQLPTPPGDYKIFYKASPYLMRSPWPAWSPYWYPDTWISYAMEFIDGGYFLHDAPWRDWFGPGSQYGNGTHGCVNIPGGEGSGPIFWLWNWAQIGDEVVVQN
ncbi:MAG TPA: L,D-transpeptidase, partial [Candidatus Dormibacteraeota bacterium]